MSKESISLGLLVLLSGLSLPAWAEVEDPAELRLIQTSDDVQTWMTPDEIADLAQRSHAEGHCGGFIDITEHPNKTPVLPDKVLSPLEGRIPSHQTEVNRLLPELSAQKIMDSIRKLSSFQNRFCRSQNGVDATQWIHAEFVRMSKGRNDVTVDFFKHNLLQPSVIARIQGKDPTKKEERIVLGGHADSINWSRGFPKPQDRAPGADDNASGVATLLETFRVLMDSGYQPDRTLEFMAYAGEEIGLVGSQDIAEKYNKTQMRVIAALQLDMTHFPGPDPKIHFINDHTDNDLTRFTEMLVDTYVKIPWVEMPCKYACSDHASWTRAGYPATFPFEAPMDSHNPKIHTEKDTIDLLDGNFGLHFAKIALSFAIELGNQ